MFAESVRQQQMVGPQGGGGAPGAMGQLSPQELLGMPAEALPPPGDQEGLTRQNLGYAPPVEEVENPFGVGAGGPMGLMGGALGVGAAPTAPTSGGGGGYAPSGEDFRGPNFNPTNLANYQGVLGVPQAMRSLRMTENRLNVPGLSEAVSGVGFRTRAQQEAAYARYRAGQGALAAPPGQSFHEQGEALDIDASWLAANPQVRPFMETHGWTWDVGGEPWHAHWVGLQGATGNQNRPIRSEPSARGRPGGRATTRRRSSTLSAYRRR
jgi:hypothetical protein